MRIVLAGKHELACRLFEFIYRSKERELSVITCKSEQEDIQERFSLKAKLRELNIKPSNVDYSHSSVLQVVKSFRPDLFISAGFDKIIKTEVIDIIPHCINIHFGLLPKYRGVFSIPQAIINNEEFIGVTLHKIDTGIDNGDIILQKEIRNDPEKSCKELYLLASSVGIDLVKKYIELLTSGKDIKPIPQNERIATHYSSSFPNQFKIDWKQTVAYAFNYIRASYFPPYFPAYTVINGQKIGIEFPVDFLVTKNARSCGTIIRFQDQCWVTALNGLIKPKSIVAGPEKYEFEEYVKVNNLIGRTFES